MTGMARWTGSAILASIAILAAGMPVPARAKPPLNLAILRQQDRSGRIHFESLIDSLEIAPGMAILDIGAGPGYASFLFAEKLRGTGTVFATDIREDFIRRIETEAKRRGLANLVPVVVKEKGLDDFYGSHRYDLVFLSNAYHCLEDRVGYFGKLRGFLNPGARLVLVMYDQVPLFTEDDFSDPEGLVATLSGAPGDDPFLKNLSGETRRLMEGGAPRGKLVRALADDFNRMLADPRFYSGFYDNSYFRKGLFTETERDFADWLLMTVEEEGSAGRIGQGGSRAVAKLNRMFFIKRFGRYLAEGGRGAYLPAGDANRHTSKYVARRELESAGYRFVKEIKLSAYYDALVFTPEIR